MNKGLLWAFLLVMAGDFLIPYLLAPFYHGYSHRRQVMSVLGCRACPVGTLYCLWLVLGGIVFAAGSYEVCRPFLAASPLAGTAALVLLEAYALGGMVLSGLFRVGAHKEDRGPAAKIHGTGSALGFTALLFAPLPLAAAQPDSMWICLALFVLALAAFSLFVMADKPRFAGTFAAQEGTWQRLSLLFMYGPVAVLVWQRLAG